MRFSFFNHHQRRAHDPQKAARQRFSQKKLNSALLLTVFFFGLLYLVQVNALATRGYAIKDLEKQIVFEKKRNEQLQMQIIEAQSIGRIQKKIEDMKLVRSESIDYITSSARTVASR